MKYVLAVLFLSFVAVWAFRTTANETSSTATTTQDPVEEANFQRAVAGARVLKKSMRNPDSFKLSHAYIVPGGAVCYEYRAQNGFGGMNVERILLSQDGHFNQGWNEYCSTAGEDKAWQIGYAAGFHGMFGE